MEWLIDEAKPIDAAAKREIAQSTAASMRGPEANLAIRLKQVVVHDVRKWFGGADIRLDTLVVHGKNPKAKKDSFYQPSTKRFSGVRDGDRLAIGDSGLLLFYGQPRHFVDLSITVSRDRKDSKDLADLVASSVKSPDFKEAAGSIIGLTALAPQAAAVLAAVRAAGTLGSLAAQLVFKATNATIGLYHNSFLQHRDAFGLGRHPASGELRANDLSFCYEVVVDKRPQSPG